MITRKKEKLQIAREALNSEGRESESPWGVSADTLNDHSDGEAD